MSDRGNWMQTYTGSRFYPVDPRPDEVHVQDIAHALSLQCRYNGHVRRFYSVAEHCYLLSYVVSAENALWALLHDATEAYVGDMVRPLKRHMPEFVAAEDRVMEAIAERYDLASATMPDEVREADTRILVDERAALMRHTDDRWETQGLSPLGVEVVGFRPGVAETLYLDRFVELREKIDK